MCVSLSWAICRLTDEAYCRYVHTFISLEVQKEGADELKSFPFSLRSARVRGALLLIGQPMSRH